MKDSTSHRDAENHITCESVISEDGSVTEDNRRGPDRAELNELKDVFARYVGQLLHGCNDPTCTETLCDTGRRNTSKQPVRKYTPRSARSIALAQVSGVRPRSRLCPKYSPNGESHLPEISEGPRDPSAFMQQVTDTETIRNLEVSNAAIKPTRCLVPEDIASRHKNTFDASLRYCKAVFDQMTALLNSGDPIAVDMMLTENENFWRGLSACFEEILDSFPSGDMWQWLHVNCIINSGCAYPQHNQKVPQKVPDEPSCNTWLDILDSLERGPTSDLLHRLMSILALRDDMEDNEIASSARDRNDVKLWNQRLVARVTTGLINEGADFNKLFHLAVLLKKYFLRHWNGEVHAIGVAAVTLKLMGALHAQVYQPGLHVNLEHQPFSAPEVSERLGLVEVAQAWLDGHRQGHILRSRFLFELRQQATYFRTVNHLRMRKANSDSAFASAMHDKLPSLETNLDDEVNYLEDRYLLLSVSRSNLLRDTFNELWQRREGELLRPLRVRLGEMDTFEIGHDLGGVQVEFFNLVCKEFMNESNQMFTTDEKTGFNYFQPGSLQPLYMFELCGLLFALAIYNGISLPINFPRAFYRYLCGGAGGILDFLDERWLDEKRSLQHVLAGDASGFDNTVPTEMNGLRLSILPTFERSEIEPSRNKLTVFDATPILHHEDRTNSNRTDSMRDTDAYKASPEVDIESLEFAWPGWHVIKASQEPEQLTDETKHRWVIDYAIWRTFGSVAPQFESFRNGFQRIFEDLEMLSFDFIRPIFEGTTHLNINELERVTIYEGFEPTSKYIQGFWTLVKEWPEEKQKQLVKFVTACERLPPGGARSLTFRIARATHAEVDHLPTSSTCFGTLMLPRYESVDVLEKKLTQALEYGAEGFGTG